MAKQSKKKEKKKCLFGLLCLFANQNPQQQLSITVLWLHQELGNLALQTLLQQHSDFSVTMGWRWLCWLCFDFQGQNLQFKFKHYQRGAPHAGADPYLSDKAAVRSWLEIHNPTKQVIGAEPCLLKLATLKEAKTESTL